MKLAFTAKVVTCETRHSSKVKRAYPVDLNANWMLTVDIEATDDAAPWRAGERASFLIHSPVQLMFVAADQAAGRRFRFSIRRGDGGKWSAFTANELLG